MPGLPQYVDPLRLAETGESIAGRLAVGAMPRLREVLSGDSGAVEFRLNFDRDEQGLVRILGEFSASVRAVCQRCLEPLELPVAGTIRVAPIEGDGTRVMPAGTEPLVLSEGRIHLLGFIEDEVLLALPIAPMHEEGMCKQRPGAKPDAGQRARPFAALEGLTLRKK